MKTVIRQANLSDSTHLLAWTIAVLLPLSWAVPASGNRAVGRSTAREKVDD
jgi:hypothetical protein